MKSGQRRNRIRIERPTYTSGALGLKQDGWEVVARVWASIKPLKAAEAVAAKQAGQETAYVVNVRYREGIDPTCRIVLREDRPESLRRYLNITGIVNVDNARKEMDISCVERRQPNGA